MMFEHSGDLRQQQMVAGFNVYRTVGVGDALDDVRVSTCYDGVVLGSVARVVVTEKLRVVVAVSAGQLKALARTRVAFVESPVHGTSFRAAVDGVDAERNEVVLRDFEPFRDFVGRRKLTRVVPSHAMVVRITRGGAQLSGRVADISASALAVVVDRDAFVRLEEAEGEIEIDAWGESDDDDSLSDFRASGRVTRVEHLADAKPPASRVVIALDAYPALTRALNRYVARRQLQILVALGAEHGSAEPV